MPVSLSLTASQWLAVAGILDSEIVTQAQDGDEDNVVASCTKVHLDLLDQLPEIPEQELRFRSEKMITVRLERSQWELVASTLGAWAASAERTGRLDDAAQTQEILTAVDAALAPGM